MRRHLSGRLALAIGVLMAAPYAATAQSGAWALTNARIETVTRGVIDGGTIIIRDGIIEAVGVGIPIPPDARVLDLATKTVYPGFMDLTSTIGLPAPPAPRAPGNVQAAIFGGAVDTTQRNVGLEPDRLLANEIRPALADVQAARDAGITTALVAPSRGLFRGQSALIPLRDDTATRWTVRSPVALHMGYQTVPGRYPGSLLGVIAYQRQALLDAQRHALLVERSKANTRSARPSYDADLEALVPAVKGEMPTFVAAGNENEIRRAVALGKEFNLKLSVVGAVEGFRAVDVLRGQRLPIVTVDYPDPTAVTGWNYRGATRNQLDDSATRSVTARKEIEGNAAALSAAGIKFALASGGLRPAEFLGNVKKAIAAGLPRQTALEGLTIRAAEAAGVQEQLGSIEAGKIANLLVMRGEALTDGGVLEAVFIDGLRYAVIAQPAERRPGGGRPGPEEHK